MPIDIKAVQDSASLPTEVDVAVVGGGIIGVCTAYELARRGISVALLEKGMVGGEQSGRNWGWVRQQNRAVHELEMAMFSLLRWEQLGAETGQDLGFRRTGILYCTTKADDLALWESWGKLAREKGFRSDILSATDARDRTRGVARWIGGVWSPTDGRAEPSLAVPGIAEGAKRLGVSLHQNCAVRGLEISAGSIRGVWTERGLVRAGAVVCAGGAWTSRLLRRHGIQLPVANIGGTAIRTSAAPEIVDAGCLSTPTYAVRRRIDGSFTLAVPGHGVVNIAPQGVRHAVKFYQMYRSKVAKKLKFRLNSSFWNGPEAFGGWDFDQVSPFERIRVLDPEPDSSLVEHGIKALVSDFPQLEGISVAASWGGFIDTTPDLMPVISKVAGLNGLVISSGFSGHGFGIGPGAGRLTSELVLHETPFTDPSPYRLDRFSDGSAIQRPEMM